MTDSNDETTLLAEEVGRLREALKEARESAKTWKDDAKWLKRKFQIANFWAWMVGVALVGAIGGLVLYPAYMGITSSNTATHCYIVSGCGKGLTQNDCPCHTLKGAIDWRTDVTMGTFGTLEQAIEAAKVMQCPLRAADPR